MQPEDVGEESGQRIADADADDGGHRQESDRRTGTLDGQVVTGDTHQRRQAQAGALGDPPGQQPAERQRYDGQQTTTTTTTRVATRPRAEPPEDRRRDRADEQRGGERPLCGCQRDAELACHPR